MKKLFIDSSPLTFELIDIILQENLQLELSDESVQLIQKCRQYLDQWVETQSEPIYGITTGFGSLCNRSISKNDLSQLQTNLVISHACGSGDAIGDDLVKLMLLLKVKGLAHGNSGVQVETVTRLIDLYNNNIYPVVRELGSLGASGDLAPLAHLVLPLLGLGQVKVNGELVPSSHIREKLGWKPFRLMSKEGLALLNGTQFMSAHAVYMMLKATRLMYIADMIGAITLEAYGGRIDPFLPELHLIRPHNGQITTAGNIRSILKDSKLLEKSGKAIQDPYSIRCIPQVHGASKDALDYAGSVILKEINAVTDNPTIFPETGKILSGGNFHGQPLALVLDFAAIALAEIGSISERRTYRLLSGQRGLPEFLVAHPGLNSGFMIPQYSAASIVSQNKQLCTPSSVDSISSSNEQEDHVSMGANAATKVLRVLKNVERILAVEMLAACQALEFKGIRETSPYLQDIINRFRETVPFIHDDVLMYELMDNSLKFITTQKIEKAG